MDGVSLGAISSHTFSDVAAAHTLSVPFAPPHVTAVAPTAGSTAGATSVTISGTNLTGATAVMFGSNGN